MSCNYQPHLQNVESLGQYILYTQLEHNIKHFLDWGFLNIGGFVNINRPTNNINNTAGFHKLSVVTDPAYTNGKVWETFKKQWVYESGIMYSGSPPITISGIYVNNTFIPGPTGNVNYPYSFNYELGRVIFNNPISTTADVQMNYSFKSIQTYKSNDSFSDWKYLQEYTFKTGDVDKNIPANHRIQLPTIIVEPISKSDFKGYELGSTKYWANQSVLLHVFAENYVEKNNIVDIIRLQKDKNIRLYDLSKVVKNKIYSLNPNGSKNLSGQNYDQLVSDDSEYLWRNGYINNVSVMDMDVLNLSIYYSTIRLDLEIIV